MPKVLFVHENFPAQFGNLANYLIDQGWDVLFATAANHVPADGKMHVMGRIRTVGYRRTRNASDKVHAYLKASEHAVLNGQGFSRLAAALQKGGYTPDVVLAHSGWGSGSLAKVVWPDAKYVQYLEWWYNYPGVDAPEYGEPRNPENKMASTLCRNLPFLLDAQSADAILVPTQFQASQMPALLKPLCTVIHDGIDTGFYAPSADTPTLKNIPADAPVLTYATRGMEPLRGFPQFMSAASSLMKQRPDLHVVIAGNDSVHYGPQLPKDDSFKKRALAKDAFDMNRLHFVGHLQKPAYRDLLRRSTVHCYLTRPFVLSWSMIEAMSTGCTIVAADNAATGEVAQNGITASMVNQDDKAALTSAIANLLDDPSKRKSLGQAARAHVLKTYSAEKCHSDLRDFLGNVIDA